VNTAIDILCIGEIIIDFIGTSNQTNLQETPEFKRVLGGSVTNVAVNTTKLGLQSFLVGAVGSDALGNYALAELKKQNVLNAINQVPQSTSVILVSKSETTPEFIPYRSADCQILAPQITNEQVKNSKIFHTTCFALSENPAQETILQKAKIAFENNVKLSIDFNFSDKIWTNKATLNHAITTYLSYQPMVKISADDCLRYFGTTKTDAEIFEYFSGLGASLVCLTKGKDGVFLYTTSEGFQAFSAHKINKIEDATGAGDAFWSGFLYGVLHKKPLEKCVEIGQKIAILKLENLNGIPENTRFLMK
jgi:fructokinase